MIGHSGAAHDCCSTEEQCSHASRGGVHAAGCRRGAPWNSGLKSSSDGGGGSLFRSISWSSLVKGEKGFSTTTTALMLSQPFPQPCTRSMSGDCSFQHSEHPISDRFGALTPCSNNRRHQVWPWPRVGRTLSGLSRPAPIHRISKTCP